MHQIIRFHHIDLAGCLWGVQPGVEVHSNGRVAKISIGEFGFRGHVPAAIGQLSELVELYLGTHNDGNLLEYDPSIAPDKSLLLGTPTRPRVI